MSGADWFALVVGIIAVVALGGWAWTNIATMKASVSSANSIKVLQGITDREDAKVGALVERYERMRNHGKPTEIPQHQRPEQRDTVNPMTNLFGGVAPFAPIDEQPDSSLGLEVVES